MQLAASAPRRAVFLALCCAALRAQAKVQTGTVRFGEDANSRWQYMSKFGYALGDGEYEFRLRLREPLPSRQEQVQVDVDLYLDSDWHLAESLSPCERTSEGGPSRRRWPLPLEASGEWGEWQAGVLQHRVRPHIWYFAASDCRYEVLGNTPSALDIDFEFRARQWDGSELGVEMRHMLPVNGVMLVLLTGLLIVHTLLCGRFRRSAGELHPVIWALSAAMVLQLLSQVLHAAHLYLCHADGRGLWAVDALSENLAMAGQVLHTGMFIALAQGYTLVHHDLGELQLSRLEITAVLVTHLMLVGLGNMEDGASHVHHKLEGAAGWLMLALRLFLCRKFWKSIHASMSAVGPRMQAFLSQLRLAGNAYLLAYPVLLLVVQVFAPYLRHPVMQVGLLTVQLASSVWLGCLFLGRGAYLEVSTLGSPLLPSGASTGLSPSLRHRKSPSGDLLHNSKGCLLKRGSIADLHGRD